MPRRGSGLAQAVASTTLSLARTTQEPWACLARCPVSKEMVLPPASSTVVACFMMGILSSGASPGRIAKAFAGGKRKRTSTRTQAVATAVPQQPVRCEPGETLLTNAQFLNDVFVALGIVGLQVVEQATPLADHHQKATPGRVVVLVGLEVLRQLSNPLAQNRDLHLGTAGVA